MELSSPRQQRGGRKLITCTISVFFKRESRSNVLSNKEKRESWGETVKEKREWGER